MFGSQAPRPAFGAGTSTFGTNFGAPATTQSGFGSFGKPGGFGTPQQSTSFGTAATPFGATTSTAGSLFGAQTAPTTGGLFGQQQQQQQPASSFTQTTTGFGNTGGTGLFGQTQQAQPAPGGLFGSGGGFGTQASKPAGFGFGTTPATSTASGSLFGAAQPNTGGLFGSSTGAFGANTGAAVTGTTVKYAPVTGTDTMTRNGVSTNIQTRIEVISTMKEYESKSLEELRVEDYLANRKGPGQGTVMGVGAFGQTPTAQPTQQPGGLFGSTPGTGGIFGQTKPPENKPLFGASATTSTTGFGPTSGGLFGSTSTAASPFGQTNTAPSTGFSFGQTQNQTKPGGFSFGQTQPASTGGLFGQTQTAQPVASTPGFGGATTSGFGQPATGGLFANKPAGFATQPATTGLFGAKPATTGCTGFGGSTGSFGTGSFGATSTASPFGQTTTPATGGLFGTQNTQQKTGGLFGQTTGFGTTSGGGLFGNTQQKTGLNFMSNTTAFGTPQQPALGMGTNMSSGGLFGNTGTNNQAGAGFGNTLGIGGNTGMGMQQGSVVGGVQPNLATLVKAMTQQPFQDIPLLKRTTQSPASGGESGDTTDGASGAAKPSSGALKPTYVLSSSPANLIKPKPKPLNKGGGGSGGGNGNRHWLFKGLDEPAEGITDDDPLKPKSFPSVKKLNLKVFKGPSKNESAALQQQQSVGVESTNGDAPSLLTTPLTTPLTNPLSSALSATPIRQSLPPSHENSPTPDIIKGRDKIKHLNLAEKQTPLDDTLADLNVRGSGNELAETAELNETDAEANKENNISLFDVSTAEEQDATACNISSPHPAGVKLTRNGYYTLPPLEELAEMVDDQGKCLAENFTVGRQGYGNVCFLGTTDVSGLDIDTLVFILRKQVEVYPEGCTKPPQGQGLNKSAIITLDCVWPVDKTTREVIKNSERLDLMQWAQYLERQCYKMESSFVEYRPDTGSWVFKVKHFSKYGLGDDDDDDAEMAAAKPPPSNIVKPLHGGIPPLTGRTTGPPATALASPLHHGPLASMASIAQQPAKQVFLDQESDMGEDPYMDLYAFQPVESAAYNIMSPSEERLNMASRVAPRTVQLMKSQLFSMDEDDGTQIRDESPATPKLSAKKLMLQDKSLNTSSAIMSPAPEKNIIKPKVILQPTQSTMEVNELDNDSEALSVSVLRDPRSEYQVLPSGREIGKETGYAPPQHQAKPVPLDASRIAGQDRYLADMGAFMGRSFRVGWGPGWTLVHAGPSLSPGGSGFEDSPSVVLSQPAQTPLASFLFSSATQTTTTKPAVTTESQRYRLTVERVMCDELSDHSIDALTELTLLKVLECSIVSKDEISDEDTPQCPYIQPETNTNMLEQISEHLNYMTSENAPLEDGEVNVANIFNLCMALWGNQDFYSPEFDGDSDYVKARVTVEAISQWIECCSSQIVESEVSDATNSQEDDPEAYLKAVYSHLSARQISQASMLAQQKGDHHLALLLSQACGDETPRQYLAAQLANWAEGGTDGHMSILRLTIYSLLAGSATHQASHTLINTCQGLDWKRAFGLHLWFMSPATATISEALKEYEAACGLSGDDPYCAAPLPSYIVNKSLPKGMDVKHGYDVCYHLLKLFTDPTHKLEGLLNSWTISNDPLCVYVSWLLWSVLRSLGYHHLSDVASASLNLAMAALLESEGHWHWAAFVLLHIEDNERRCGEVKQLIARHITLQEGGKEAEEFLTLQLKIPDKWLFEAKATMARSLHLIDEEAWYLLKAGNFNRAHKLIVETIAPNAVINEDHEYLHRYLDQLSDPSIFENIVNWASGGAVYADYLDVISLVNEMKKTGEPTAAKLELLRPRLLTLCQRLNNLKCESAVHRLCVSEMSRVVVGVLRAVLGDGSEATQVLAQQLSSLPITHDYALAELNLVTTHYLTHLAET